MARKAQHFGSRTGPKTVNCHGEYLDKLVCVLGGEGEDGVGGRF